MHDVVLKHGEQYGDRFYDCQVAFPKPNIDLPVVVGSNAKYASPEHDYTVKQAYKDENIVDLDGMEHLVKKKLFKLLKVTTPLQEWAVFVVERN